MTEADTCREFVTPRLVEAGWGAAESVIGEQHSFTNGRIIVAGGKVRRGKQRRADYLNRASCQARANAHRVFVRPGARLESAGRSSCTTYQSDTSMSPKPLAQSSCLMADGRYSLRNRAGPQARAA
jgi:hypothetical protein